MLDALRDKGLLGLIAKQSGRYQSDVDSVELSKLGGLNASWRKFVSEDVALPLKMDADKFVLAVGGMCERGELAAVVKLLLHLRNFKDEILHLHAITALHVACTTGHYLAQSQNKRTTIMAGGVEAIINVMIMHRSSVSLNVLCMRMIILFAPYERINNITWGWWSERQAIAAMDCIVHAMQTFTTSLDLQCSAADCLMALCNFSGDIGDSQRYLCRRELQDRRGIPLLISLMHVHTDMALYVNICRLMSFFVEYDSVWSDIGGGQSELVMLQALEQSVANAHYESVLLIVKMMYDLCKDRAFLANVQRMPLCTTVLEQSLQLTQARTQTESAADTIMKHKTLFYLTKCLRLMIWEDDSLDRFVLLPGSVNLLVQVLSESHNLNLLQPPEIFTDFYGLEVDMCTETQHNICLLLRNIALTDSFVEIFIEGNLLPDIFTIVNETIDKNVRTMALVVVNIIAREDTNERLLVLAAGGLPIMANFIRKHHKHNSESITVFVLIRRLLGFPVYETAMLELGFLSILKPFEETNTVANTVVRLLEAANNPVYPP